MNGVNGGIEKKAQALRDSIDSVASRSSVSLADCEYIVGVFSQVSGAQDVLLDTGQYKTLSAFLHKAGVPFEKGCRLVFSAVNHIERGDFWAEEQAFWAAQSYIEDDLDGMNNE